MRPFGAAGSWETISVAFPLGATRSVPERWPLTRTTDAVGLARAPLAVDRARELDRPDPEADRRDGGHRRHGVRHGQPARAQRAHVRPLVARGIEDPRPESGRWCGRLDRERERAGGAAEPRELLLAFLARREVLLVARRLVATERVERIRGGVVVQRQWLHAISSASPSNSRRRARPVNILLLMVPTGWPSLSASSDCVNPP